MKYLFVLILLGGFFWYTTPENIAKNLNNNLYMRAKTFIAGIFLLVVCLMSCDPGIGVAISNHTATDKWITVIYPPDFKFPGDAPNVLGVRDSIKTYPLTLKNNYLYSTTIPKLSWDTVARTYSFILKSNHEAIVESRTLALFPTLGQVFIIDQADTVKLLRKDKDFRKTPKLLFGGTWRHEILERK